MTKTHDSTWRSCRRSLTFSHKAFYASAFLILIGFTIPIDVRMIRNLHHVPAIDDQNKDKGGSTSLHQSSSSGKNKPRFGQNETLRIAWLLSFPNSGTSFTMKHLRHSGTETDLYSNHFTSLADALFHSFPFH